MRKNEMFNMQKQNNIQQWNSKMFWLLILGFLLIPIVNADAPSVNWVFPTPDNNSYWNSSWLSLNVTVNETKTTCMFNWNYTLAGYWSADKCTDADSIADNSTYGLNGGGVSWTCANIVKSVYGNGTKFDGVGGYYQIQNGISAQTNFTNDSFTVMAWAMRNGSSGGSSGYECGILGHGVGGSLARWMIEYQCTTGDILTKVFTYNGNVPYDSGGAEFADNKPHHVALVVDRVNKYMVTYFDGQIKNNQSIALLDGRIDPDGRLTIGRGNSGTVGFVNGSVDEAIIFRRLLTGEEINRTMNSSILGANIGYGRNLSISYGHYEYASYCINEFGGLAISSYRNVSYIAYLAEPFIQIFKPFATIYTHTINIPLEYHSGNVTDCTYSINYTTNETLICSQNASLNFNYNGNYYIQVYGVNGTKATFDYKTFSVDNKFNAGTANILASAFIIIIGLAFLFLYASKNSEKLLKPLYFVFAIILTYISLQTAMVLSDEYIKSPSMYSSLNTLSVVIIFGIFIPVLLYFILTYIYDILINKKGVNK
jgi:hypothetical protein